MTILYIHAYPSVSSCQNTLDQQRKQQSEYLHTQAGISEIFFFPNEIKTGELGWPLFPKAQQQKQQVEMQIKQQVPYLLFYCNIYFYVLFAFSERMYVV